MIRQETAETIALHALTWLLAQEDRLADFLAESGASVGDLASVAGDAPFLGSVLDFLLRDDATVIAVCDAIGLPPDGLLRARSVLPGGDVPDWT
jgi:hypothetical protein